MLAKWSINSGSIVSTGLEFLQATVLAEPWVSLSELAIILWNDCLEGSYGQNWYRNLRSEHMDKSQAESAEAITSPEPPVQLHSPDILHLPQIAYNWGELYGSSWYVCCQSVTFVEPIKWSWKIYVSTNEARCSPRSTSNQQLNQIILNRRSQLLKAVTISPKKWDRKALAHTLPLTKNILFLARDR